MTKIICISFDIDTFNRLACFKLLLFKENVRVEFIQLIGAQISTSRTGRRGVRRGAGSCSSGERMEVDPHRISPSPCSTPRPPSSMNGGGCDAAAPAPEKLYPCSVCNK